LKVTQKVLPEGTSMAEPSKEELMARVAELEKQVG